ncbi:MAG: hypothetical protein H6718_25860 [Polyangiaceae bacterium]|nr:hypothetical protein [Polyangiaceae bacterium]MCB9605423.1 hypothetical protein [Polyangiaceae bacterium]
MRTAAPGKLVLSGAYAVLHGAPALVTAVDRYVFADSAGQPAFEPPEVLAALRHYPGRQVPRFDASELRSGDQKLGLGSSAAITVSAVALWELEAGADPQASDLGALAYPAALAAHREAQGGGSGIDVAAASFGGTLRARRADNGDLELRSVELPPELAVEVWWTGVPASTPQLLRQVAALEANEPARFERLMGAQAEAAERTATAVEEQRLEATLAGLQAQFQALAALGEAATAPIVSVELRQACAKLDATEEVWLPAGAGGGDVLMRYRHPASTAAPPSAIERSAQRLPLTLAARGVHFRP